MSQFTLYSVYSVFTH